MEPGELDKTVRLLEKSWKDTCLVLDDQEKALVETYLAFLRGVARTCLENGCRAWFRPNRVVHWGEGGFGRVSILLPPGKPKPLTALPGEIEFLTDLSDKQRLGEEITLATLDRITYKPDGWI